MLNKQVVYGFTHQHGTRNPRSCRELVQVVELLGIQIRENPGSRRFSHMGLYKLSRHSPSRGLLAVAIAIFRLGLNTSILPASIAFPARPRWRNG